MTWFEGFTRHTTEVNGQTVCYRSGGKLGAPVLVLLHGFPQTHVMWHRVAQALQHHFFVVMPDLRGYGDSSHHLGGPDHSHHSKRAMACGHFIPEALPTETAAELLAFHG